jgi:protein-L-isoaspartate O-methyltransferase
MKKIDRKLFISERPKNNSYYENKPYKISGGQTMSDVFTHAVILEEATRIIG